jgi:ATP-binding cassette subfamily B protein
LFRKIQYLPVPFFQKYKTGDLISRISSDLDNISRLFTETAQRFFNAIFTMFFIGAAMFWLSYKLTLIAMASVLIISLLLWIQSKILGRYIRKMLALNAQVSSLVQEILSGFVVYKIFGQEEFINKKFEQSNDEHFKAAKSVSLFTAILSPVTNFIGKVIVYAVIVYGFYMMTTGEMTTGVLLSFTVYLAQFFVPITNLGELSKSWQDGLSSISRIKEIMNYSSGIEAKLYKKDNGHNAVIKGKIEFKDVQFSYGNNLVLDKVNFVINPYEHIAIVGTTGSGKTSFVNLIARLYEPQEGSILIDGVDIKDWNLKNLRGQIGYLLQDSYLFSGNVLDNLKYGNEGITIEQCKKMWSQIGGDGFVGDINTDVAKCSMGQKQLIAIGRLLLRRPRLLILDEPTASIDTRSEKIVQKAIDLASKNITTITIAHRPNTIRNADRIVSINKKRVNLT